MDSGGGGAGILGAIFGLLYLAAVIAMLAGGWKIFVKAGKPGWAAIIPIYNYVVLLEIIEKPIWWIILLLIPLVQFVILIIIAIGVAEKFGKGAGFGIGMVLLAPIFLPMLGFGDAQYQG